MSAGEYCRTCPLADYSRLQFAPTICSTPSEVCTTRLNSLEAKLKAWNRLRALATLCGHEALDLTRLCKGDIIKLFCAPPDQGYRHPDSRELAFLVDKVDETGILNTRLVKDSYWQLPLHDERKPLEIPEGGRIDLIGYWDKADEQPMEGVLLVGVPAVYRDGTSQHGVLLQEIAITDPAGVTQMMWGTNPLQFQPAPNFLQ